MNIKWDILYSVENEEIDEHHKKLFVLINRLIDISKSIEKLKYIEDILLEIKEYAHYHFTFEEKLMNEYSYIKIEMHKKEHQNFINKINEIEEKIKSDDRRIAILNLRLFLVNWLVHHILTEDKEFSKFINKTKEEKNV